jgi:hypothetical protein
MRDFNPRVGWCWLGLLALLAGGAACKGTVGGGGLPSGGGGNGVTGAAGAGGGLIPPPLPFQAGDARASVRKVKNLLTGQAPTDADVATVTASGAAGLQTLITTWMTDPQFQPNFRDKMIFFFRNAFQQTGFIATEDFKMQLQQNGGFDFGPLGTGAVGDDAFARLVQNIQDSFAITAYQLVLEGNPLTDVLTTRKFMMTTGLKSLYIQIEMPNDQPYSSGTKLAWKMDMSGTAIPLTDTLNPASPNYMVFDDEPPVTAARFLLQPTCQGTATVNPFGGTEPTTGGYSQLFQRLIGYTPRWQFLAAPQCWEHPSKPYLTTQDLSDWQWVSTRALNAGETRIQPYDLPTLRTTTDLGLALTRVGYYTTPAYLALWNTNDSNAHRVTANQALLVGLGQSFTSESQITPLSTAGLDPNHAVTGTDCYGCHKSLDPMRQFWANEYDFNDRNDFPARASFTGSPANPRPASKGGVFAFGSVNAAGADITDFGRLLGQVVDSADPANPVHRFALAMTQKLCFFANSAPCVETDPEFRRVALVFENSTYDFPTLVKELFSSPLVTGASDTATFDANGITISVARRDQLCAALSNRLAKPDLCSLAVPIPSTTQAVTSKIATSVAADAFSRGAESPVTPSDPTPFYRAATEMLCENVATQVVDATAGTVWASSSFASAIDDMVVRVMGYPASDPMHTQAASVLTDHYNAVLAQKKSSATIALRSAFVLACESPTALSFGL